MAELKPCPFCLDGGEPKFKDGWQREDGEFYHGYVKCTKCGTIKLSKSLSDYLGTIRHGFVSDEVIHNCSLTAIQFWNTRHERTCKIKPWKAEYGLYDTMISECGYVMDVGEWARANFCPKCGAKVV